MKGFKIKEEVYMCPKCGSHDVYLTFERRIFIGNDCNDCGWTNVDNEKENNND